MSFFTVYNIPLQDTFLSSSISYNSGRTFCGLIILFLKGLVQRSTTSTVCCMFNCEISFKKSWINHWESQEVETSNFHNIMVTSAYNWRYYSIDSSINAMLDEALTNVVPSYFHDKIEVKSRKAGSILSRNILKYWDRSVALNNETASLNLLISFWQHFQADLILSGVLFSVLNSVCNSSICTNSFENLDISIVFINTENWRRCRASDINASPPFPRI